MAPLTSTPGAIPDKTTERGRASAARTLRWVRKMHLYFGLFITPALLFFALTGALQTFNLHEPAGESYQPPAWIAHLAQIHKNQTAQLRPRRPGPRPGPLGASLFAAGPDAITSGRTANQPQPPSASARAADPVHLASKARQHLPLKIFFLLVSLGLFSSSLTGIFMAYRFERNNVLVTVILVAGLVIPLILLPF